MPVKVSLPGKAILIGAGWSHSIAVLESGECWAWGDNSDGQLGDGTTSDRIMPVKVSLPGKAIAISTGKTHNIAVLEGGECWAWGFDGNVELGDGTTTNNITPVKVSLLGKAINIGTGYYHSIAVLEGGTMQTKREVPEASIAVPEAETTLVTKITCSASRTKITELQKEDAAGKAKM